MFLGLDIVVPLMSGELLAVPKLARLYFGLLCYMLEIWPARVADLPGKLFTGKDVKVFSLVRRFWLGGLQQPACSSRPAADASNLWIWLHYIALHCIALHCLELCASFAWCDVSNGARHETMATAPGDVKTSACWRFRKLLACA